MMLSLLAVLTAVLLVPAPNAPVPAQIAAGGPRAVLVGDDGLETATALAEFEVEGPQAFRASLVRFEGLSAAGAPAPDAASVELAGGERLFGSIAGGSGERFDVRLADGLTLGVELERLLSLRFESRLVGAPAVEPAVEGDRIYRVQARGVERIDGAVEGFTEAGVRFHGALVGTIAIPWRNVAALFVEHLGAAPATLDPKALPVALDLADGSRVHGTLTAVRRRVIELARHGATVRVPLESALQMSRDDGSVSFLANRPMKSEDVARPFGDELGMVWPARVDRNVQGGPLRSGGVRHPRGLGVHAPSRAVWALDGSGGVLRGFVALDDEVLRLPTRGSCVFRVEVDGREAFASSLLRAGDAPLPFAVDLAGAREVALVVEPTDDGFAGDRANWLGLAVYRARAPGSSSR